MLQTTGTESVERATQQGASDDARERVAVAARRRRVNSHQQQRRSEHHFRPLPSLPLPRPTGSPGNLLSQNFALTRTYRERLLSQWSNCVSWNMTLAAESAAILLKLTSVVTRSHWKVWRLSHCTVHTVLNVLECMDAIERDLCLSWRNVVVFCSGSSYLFEQILSLQNFIHS